MFIKKYTLFVLFFLNSQTILFAQNDIPDLQLSTSPRCFTFLEQSQIPRNTVIQLANLHLAFLSARANNSIELATELNSLFYQSIEDLAGTNSQLRASLEFAIQQIINKTDHAPGRPEQLHSDLPQNLLSILIKIKKLMDIKKKTANSINRIALHAAKNSHIKLIRALILRDQIIAILENPSSPQQYQGLTSTISQVGLSVDDFAEPWDQNTSEHAHPNFTVLHLSIHYYSYNRDIAKLLIEHFKSVDVRDIFGNTPLHISAKEGLETVSELLIAYGALIDAKSNQERTPLFDAISYDRKNIIRLLLKHNANPNSQDQEGYSALHVAALTSSPYAARLLINSGAFINALNHHQETPLHVAARSRIISLSLIKLLIKNGADPSIKNSDGMLPIDVARTPEVKKVIQKAMLIWDKKHATAQP